MLIPLLLDGGFVLPTNACKLDIHTNVTLQINGERDGPFH